MSDPYGPIVNLSQERAKRSGGGQPPGDWQCLATVPSNAPVPLESHRDLGAPTSRWTYRSADGAVMGFACRFDGRDGKQFRPLTLWRNVKNQMLQWRWTAWPDPRPLYGLDRLAADPDGLVVVCEGEKATDATAQLLPDVIAITSPNGSKSAAKADWSALAGRRVIVWPDSDSAGLGYAEDVTRLAAEAGAEIIGIVVPPADAPEGWDVADALAEGWTTAQAEALLATARKPQAQASAAAGGGKVVDATARLKGRRRTGGDDDDGPRIRPKDQLVAMIDEVELWRDEGGKSYATFPVGDHLETWQLNSQAFRRWLAHRSYKEVGLAPTGSAIEDAVRVADARAADGAVKAPMRRVGWHAGSYWLDLADNKWRTVKVTPAGWTIVEKSGVPFVRSAPMRPLPLPEEGVEQDLQQFLAPFTANVEESDFPLLAAWLIGALRERGPYPVAVLNSRQDSGKSTLTTLMRSLVDPNLAPIRAAPRDDRDLIVTASNSHVIALDNLSNVPAWLGDALCRLATGGGFGARMLHTDDEESVMAATKPIILNGIPALTAQPDLASRALILRLKPIADSARLAAEEFDAMWEIARPKVLGLLLDAMARGFADVGKTKRASRSRMAGFEDFAVAALPALGVDPHEFLTAYAENRKGIVEQAFESDPVAVAIRAMVLAEAPQGWHGTASDLLVAIQKDDYVPFSTQKSPAWPRGVASLGNRVDRVAPLLESVGLLVTKRHSGNRLISIVPKA